MLCLHLFITDYQGEVHRQGADRAVRDRHVVFLALPGGVREAGQAVHLRVLPQVHEAGEDLQIPPGTHGIRTSSHRKKFPGTRFVQGNTCIRE